MVLQCSMAGRRLLLLVALLVSVSAECPEGDEACTEEDPVLDLDDGNFQDAVREPDIMLVEFYTTWCLHCHNLVPLYTKAARMLLPHNIPLARVNIENAVDTAKRYHVGEVPQLRIFRRGLVFPYEGPGEESGAQGIVDYMLKEQLKHNLAKDPVITLTEDNFDQIVSTSDLILVEFYADWCVHCQVLEPHFAAAARRLRENDPPVLLGKVKVPDQMELAKRYGITGYPLLFMFRYGKQYNYTGPREEEGIVEYMRKQVGPSSSPLESTKLARAFSSSSETRAIGFFDAETDPRLISEFLDSGNMVRNDLRLGHTTDRTVAEELGFPVNSVVIFHPKHLVSKYEPGHTIITDLPPNATALVRLYLEHYRPLVGEMTRDNFDRAYRHRPMLFAYYDVKWDRENIKATQYWHDIIASVAKDFRETNLGFTIANEESYPNDLRALGLEDWGEDVAVGLFAPGPTKYRMTEDFSSDALREFVQAYLDGELDPYLSSQPPPRENKGTLVKTIVGSTFQSMVLDPNKNVMVKLCIPTLPDCQKAAEYYPKVAERFQGVKGLIFGEMNVALNDPPIGTKFDVLPAFFFSAKGSSEMSPVAPQPTDDADLVFFLKWKQNIKPLKSDKDMEKSGKKKLGKKKEGKKKEGKKKEGKKGEKEKRKKKSRDEL